MTAAFEIRGGEGKGWIFELKIENQMILRSDTYRTFSGCLNGVESCREHSPYDRFFGKGKDQVSFTFHLRAANNRIIGLGCISPTPEKRDMAISLVKSCAQAASIHITHIGGVKK